MKIKPLAVALIPVLMAAFAGKERVSPFYSGGGFDHYNSDAFNMKEIKKARRKRKRKRRK